MHEQRKQNGRDKHIQKVNILEVKKKRLKNSIATEHERVKTKVYEWKEIDDRKNMRRHTVRKCCVVRRDQQ